MRKVLRHCVGNRRQRRQRGAVAIVMALVICFVVIPLGALAVDIGMQRVARNDMQAVADTVALDLARNINGGRLSSYSLPDLIRQANDDAARDLGAVGSKPSLTVELGTTDGAKFGTTGYFTRSTDPDDVPSAIRVTAGTIVSFGLARALPGSSIGSGSAERSAIGTARSGACFQIGSYAARLNSGKSPLLAPLLGAINSNINLSVADYKGLANASVSLIDLLGVDLGAGTVEELIKGNRLVSLKDYYLIVAEAIKRGSGQTAQVALLQSIAAKLGAVALNVPIADLLHVGTGGAEGLSAALNALDLVTAGAFAANGSNAISVPQLKVDLGPIAGVQARVRVIEPPAIGCGSPGDPAATANSAAIRISLDATALTLNLGLISTKVTISGTIDVASATGSLSQVRCAPDGITVHVADALTKVNLKLDVDAAAVFGLISAVKAPIVIGGSSPASGDAMINIVKDPDDYQVPVTVGANNSGLPWLVVDTSALTVLSLPLGSITDLIVSPLLSTVVNPLVQSLDKVLLTPLLQTLGADVTGADVYAIKAPACGAPQLVG